MDSTGTTSRAAAVARPRDRRVGRTTGTVPVGRERFAPGRVVTNIHLPLAGEVEVTDHRPVPGTPVDVIPDEVVE